MKDFEALQDTYDDDFLPLHKGGVVQMKIKLPVLLSYDVHYLPENYLKKAIAAVAQKMADDIRKQTYGLRIRNILP